MVTSAWQPGRPQISPVSDHFHQGKPGLLYAIPPPRSLTVRPWKASFPIGMYSSNHHFSGAMLNYGGVCEGFFKYYFHVETSIFTKKHLRCNPHVYGNVMSFYRKLYGNVALQCSSIKKKIHHWFILHHSPIFQPDLNPVKSKSPPIGHWPPFYWSMSWCLGWQENSSTTKRHCSSLQPRNSVPTLRFWLQRPSCLRAPPSKWSSNWSRDDVIINHATSASHCPSLYIVTYW